LRADTVAFATSAKSAIPKVEYSVSMLNPNSHCFDVEIRLRRMHKDSVTFAMPVWTPGMYFIHEFERNVQEFQAFDDRMDSLEWKKVEKNAWRVQTRGRAGVRARYRVYAYENRVDTSYLDIDHARINPSSVLMLVEGFLHEPSLVRLTPHPFWRKVSTSLRRVGGRGYTFSAMDYDNLVDSPIEIGNYETRTFTACGKRHEVALLGTDGMSASGFVADLKRIVEAATTVCGDVPYDRYVFLIELTEDFSSGLEHMNSTLCRLSRLSLQPRHVYNRALGLFSHEFFHLWNAKRIRPVALGPFDYSKENYTRSLWVAEGITNYYDDLILRRAGIYTVPEYLDTLADQFGRFLATPGRKVQSAEESSFDSWIKFSRQFFRSDENSINSGVSYYNKGSILGWLIDMEIRRATGSSKTLDHVMRRVYADGRKKGRGYTDEEFQRACELTAGESLSDIFEKYVKGTKEIEFDRYLGYAGLHLENRPDEVDEKDPRGFLGVRLKTEAGRLVIDSVLAETPAYQDGLYARDSIQAVDGLITDENEFAYYIRSRKPGSVVGLTIGRDRCERTLKVKVGKRPRFLFRIVTRRRADTEEKTLFEKWLGAKWGRITYEEREPLPPIQAVESLFFRPKFV
jgi:predicted metalloprotease with PDZ domain